MYLIKTTKQTHSPSIEFDIPKELDYLFADRFYIMVWSYYWHRYEELY